MEFNKQYWIDQLTKEVGLMGTPYEDLKNHDVELASPTGRNTGFKVNAKEYVDKQLESIAKDYDTFETTIDEEQRNPTLVEMTPITPEIEPIKPAEIKPENIRFFDVTINNVPFTVIFHDDKTQTAIDHINLILDKRFFIKERKREDMLGLETMISIYQYISAIANIPREPQDYTAFEHISQRMDTVFDGLKLQGII
jgi:hypothetical protein